LYTVNKKAQKTERRRTETGNQNIIFMRYRGRITDNFEKSLYSQCNAPCKVIMTLKKENVIGFTIFKMAT